MRSARWRRVAALALVAWGCGRDPRTPVVVYSPHGRDQLKLLEAAFERWRPDIDVRWLDMGARKSSTGSGSSG